ncbi:MAG: Transketolase N-terminal section [Ignavibacteria bacterium]|nr:Transketolase N-terminal section [Ignavibacteria bacterium]
MTFNIDKLKQFANTVRLDMLDMIYKSQTSHFGSALSTVEILTVLYNEILQVFPQNPKSENRDRFFLSKGHACTSLYAVLAEKGFFDKTLLQTYGDDGSLLMSHISSFVPGVEFSTGSLGHALPVALGTAMAGKKKKSDWRVFVLMSDGELDEGSNWEAFLAAPNFKLDNLFVVIDCNKIQAMGETKDIMQLEPLTDKLLAFGWNVERVDGHDFESIHNAFQSLFNKNNARPGIIIADTVKGKGISFMENTLLWHYKSPNQEQYLAAQAELNQI